MPETENCKFRKVAVKSERAISRKKVKGLFIALKGNFKTTCTIWLKFELVRNFMPVIDTCKFEGAIKTEGATARTTFSPFKSVGPFSCHGNHSSEPICSKTICSQSPTPTMLSIKFN